MLSGQTTYLEHFGLRERPFSNAADLRFVYVGPHHEQAVAHLLQGLAAPGGIVLLTGDSGLGKTTTCRVLLSRLPERVDVVPILNPSLTPVELLVFACAELGVRCDPDGADPAVLCNALRAKLAARLGARRTVLIVDDAQGLGPDVMDQLSALSSMEVDGRKLLEIVLIGEPELIDLVGRASGPRRPSRRATICCRSANRRPAPTCAIASRPPAPAICSTTRRCAICIGCRPACQGSST
jgi:general secretion pathway protein A